MTTKHSLDRESIDQLADYLRGTIANDICLAMEELEINANQLAKKLGKSRQYVGKLLNESSNFKLSTIASVAVALEREAVVRLKKSDEVVEILPYSDWVSTHEGSGAICIDVGITPKSSFQNLDSQFLSFDAAPFLPPVCDDRLFSDFLVAEESCPESNLIHNQVLSKGAA
jgi:transcriptional regulator with XRE-family HTH domain